MYLSELFIENFRTFGSESDGLHLQLAFKDRLRTNRGAYWTHGATYKYLQPTWIETMRGTAFYNRNKPEAIKKCRRLSAVLTVEEAQELLAIQRLYSKDYGRKPVGGLDWMVSKRRKKGRYSAGSIPLLSSIVFCPGCGARLVASQRGTESNRSTPFKYGCPHASTRPDLHQKGLHSVNALSLEDALLRVVRHALAYPPAGMPEKPQPKPEKQLGDLQQRIDRLVAMHLDGKIQDTDYQRLYAELVNERDSLQREARHDAQAEQRRKVEELAGKDDLTREELRQLVLLMVESVEAPVTVEGVTVRSDLATLRRLAHVTLRFPTVAGTSEYMAAIYQDGFSGNRRLVPHYPGDLNQLREIIPDAAAERQRYKIARKK